MKTERLRDKLPASEHRYLSLNILMSEKSEVDDGIRKKTEKPRFPEGYRNGTYGTRIYEKAAFYKLTCINDIAK